MPQDSPRSFDPSAYLTEHRGRKYLEVKWRLLWLRTEHPDAEIATEEIASGGEGNDAWVKFRSRVSIPGRGSATGHALQYRRDFPAGYYEKTETKSLGRALVCLGYGTQFATEFDEDADSINSPVDTPIDLARARPRAVRRTVPPVEAAVTPKAATWNEFWLAVRRHKADHPDFDETTVVGRDPSKRMTAEEAMRRFREAVEE